MSNPTDGCRRSKILLLGAHLGDGCRACPQAGRLEARASISSPDRRPSSKQSPAICETRGAAAVSFKVMDLDDTAAHPQMLASAVEKLGQIDLALIAHGVLGDQEQAQTDYAVAEAILVTNFLSAVSLSTWLGNYFEDAKKWRAGGDFFGRRRPWAEEQLCLRRIQGSAEYLS